ncbi:uncharacterized protein DDB_G0274171-like [Diabrotica virgifera virgifera]|uniref:Uncharacterized protein n=1 Tax=Diabrotica virgifera virgifera TaxID=50390 RepID=A0ABM5L2Y4_DIAVI|nr:uncharacterized protein DDB_G0274171-like [Diabrotica virgifera virgifera]
MFDYCATDEHCKFFPCDEPKFCEKGLVLKKLPCKCCRECVPEDCEVDCSERLCLKPKCPRGQVPTKVDCKCCPRCARAEYLPDCNVEDCPELTCKHNEMKIDAPCRCCQIFFTFLNISYVFAANPNCTQIPEYCPTDEECTRVDCFEPETCGKGLVLKKFPCKCCRECVPEDCEVNCAAVQCLKPKCPRGQIPTTFRCRCCPRCAPAEYEPYCDEVRCRAISCRPNEVSISYVFAANPNCTQIPEYCPTDEECTRVDCFEPETCGKGLVLKKLPCRCCRECVPVNCEVNCAAVQCLKPTCPRGQIPTTFRCRCCPRCAPAEYEPFCDGVRCLAVACRPNEVSPDGRRSIRRPTKRWKDAVKEYLEKGLSGTGPTNMEAKLPISCPLACLEDCPVPEQCQPGYVLKRFPCSCCPKCVPKCEINCTKAICPQRRCARGYILKKDPSLLPCPKRPCLVACPVPPQCQPGYTLRRLPCSCCPTCEPKCKVNCTQAVCPRCMCEPGQILKKDPSKLPINCPPIACVVDCLEPESCQPGYVLRRLPCSCCPICVPKCEINCTQAVCPQRRCAPGYILKKAPCKCCPECVRLLRS